MRNIKRNVLCWKPVVFFLDNHTYKDFKCSFKILEIGCERLVEAAVPCKKWHQQGCAARSTLHSDIVGGVGGFVGVWECV